MTTPPRLVGLCAQCGKPLVPSPSGGMRKRFCDHTCRNRFHNGKLARKAAPPPSTQTTAEARARTLQWIYDELEADIRERGPLVAGRLNPAVEMLRKIGLELDRLAPIEQEDAGEDHGLVAV